jgi:hypothetical protein
MNDVDAVVVGFLIISTVVWGEEKRRRAARTAGRDGLVLMPWCARGCNLGLDPGMGWQEGWNETR